MGKAPLQGKSVDVTKGDLEKPLVRSRNVAKEFANTKSDDFFSPTPPLEALRLLLSHAASGRSSSTEGGKILVVDAWKAHLHACAQHVAHVQTFDTVLVILSRFDFHPGQIRGSAVDFSP